VLDRSRRDIAWSTTHYACKVCNSIDVASAGRSSRTPCSTLRNLTKGTERGALLTAPWGGIAISVTILSGVGYALQTVLDYVSVPSDVAQLVFFGFFEWDGILALLTGIIAVLVGRNRDDWTVRLGIIAIAYVALAQTIQTLWD